MPPLTSRSDRPFASNQPFYSTKGDRDQSLDNAKVALTNVTVYTLFTGLDSTTNNLCSSAGSLEWNFLVQPGTVKWRITPPTLMLTK